MCVHQAIAAGAPAWSPPAAMARSARLRRPSSAVTYHSEFSRSGLSITSPKISDLPLELEEAVEIVQDRNVRVSTPAK